MSSRLRRTSAPEEGFTLLELVITTALLLLVVSSMLTFFVSVQRTTTRQEQRSHTTDDVRLAMDRITKEVRQAQTIRTGSGASVLDMDTYVNGVAKHIVYTASGTSLTRTIDGVTQTLLTRLSSISPFTYTPSVTAPTLVGVTIQSRTQTSTAEAAVVSLTSDVRLRNR